jgi:RNA polymerase sigma factor (sigma-70 family)
MSSWCILSPVPNERIPEVGRAVRVPRLATWSMSEPRELLVEKLPVIEQIIALICRRKGMDADETEEFAAEVKLRLVKDDYAVLRAFKGRSALETYIGAVVSHALLDYRNRNWGKWRDSAEAKRQGAVAVELAKLLYREGRSIDDALTLLAPKYPALTRARLEEIEAQLPSRVRRRKVDLVHAASIPAIDEVPDPAQNETAMRISQTVCRFMERLPEEDRLILQLRFQAGLTVAEIARSLQFNQQLLYRRLYQYFDDLRAELQQVGIDAADVEQLIGSDTPLLDFRFKNGGVRPSEEGGSKVADRQEKTSS